jgi:hypothetical protein
MTPFRLLAASRCWESVGAMATTYHWREAVTLGWIAQSDPLAAAAGAEEESAAGGGEGPPSGGGVR